MIVRSVETGRMADLCVVLVPVRLRLREVPSPRRSTKFVLLGRSCVIFPLIPSGILAN
jgi:hypothetical protein